VNKEMSGYLYLNNEWPIDEESDYASLVNHGLCGFAKWMDWTCAVSMFIRKSNKNLLLAYNSSQSDNGGHDAYGIPYYKDIKIEEFLALDKFMINRPCGVFSFNVSCWDNLTRISIMYCKVNKIELCNLPCLKTVNLLAIKLEELVIRKCPLIESLYLFNNNLKSLDLEHLKELKTLNVDCNPIRELIFDEQNLKGLVLSIENTDLSEEDQRRFRSLL
jgi:hypothetical protein